MPDRRTFLASLGAAASVPWIPSLALGASIAPRRVALVLVELRGGNDALNTVVPYADARYYALRPTLAIPQAEVLTLDRHTGLHPALRPLMASWHAGELAVIRDVGDPAATQSHLRASHAWDFAGHAAMPAPAGWAARLLAHVQQHGGARVSAWTDGAPGPLTGFESVQVLRADPMMAGEPEGFTARLDRAAARVGEADGAAVIKLGLGGFDTHASQGRTHARLLATLATGLARFVKGVKAAGRWDTTWVLAYSEFGRRAAENHLGGTDHGTAGAVLALGGRVQGGVYGPEPSLDASRADRACGIDLRAVYAGFIAGGWGIEPASVLGGAAPVPVRFART